MSEVAELRILTGCHAGARVPLAGGERLGPGDDCDLILTDLGLPADAGAWIQLATGRWWVRSEAAPDSGSADSVASVQPLSAWVVEQAWGAVAYLGRVAMTVSLADAPWQKVPPGLEPASGATLPIEPPESVPLPSPAVDTLPQDALDLKDEAGAPNLAASAVDLMAHDGKVSSGPAPAPRRWQPAWIIGAALVVLLLSVFWSLLQGQEATREPPDTRAVTGPADVDPALQQRLLRDIQLAIARVDPALRLRVEALPAGGARVSGWVADIAQLDRLAEGLAEIRPTPALSVRTASDLVDDLVDVGGLEAPSLRFELLGEGRVRALGLVMAPAERDKVLALVRARVPQGIEIVDGLRVASAQGGAVQEWLRTAGFAGADARWDGEQMVIGLDIGSLERARLESLLARPATPLSGIPFVLRAREVAGRAADALRGVPVHASAAPLPFRIRGVVGGAAPYVVLGDGSKLQPGGRRAGWRLVTVEPDRLVFDGPRALVVLR